MSFRRSLFAVVCLAVLLAVPTQATIMKYLEVEELARLSSDIFTGQVISTETYWNVEHTAILTSVRVRVGEAWKGSSKAGQTVTITQAGGERDGLRMDYAGRPTFTVGEAAAFFTVRGRRDDFVIVGLKQGKMSVAGDEVRRDFTGLVLVEGKGTGSNLRTITPKQTRLPLSELRRRAGGAK